MQAAEAGQLEKVKALLGGGANPKAKDSRGATAISKARDKGHRACAEEIQSAINKADGIVDPEADKAAAAAEARARDAEARAQARGGGSSLTDRPASASKAGQQRQAVAASSARKK